jgi:hypothetical protein
MSVLPVSQATILHPLTSAQAYRAALRLSIYLSIMALSFFALRQTCLAQNNKAIIKRYMDYFLAQAYLGLVGIRFGTTRRLRCPQHFIFRDSEMSSALRLSIIMVLMLANRQVPHVGGSVTKKRRQRRGANRPIQEA